MSDLSEYRNRVAEAIWNASRADEGAISATGADHVAAALLAPGGVVAKIVADAFGGVEPHAMCYSDSDMYAAHARGAAEVGARIRALQAFTVDDGANEVDVVHAEDLFTILDELGGAR